jgi:formylglycine-generating enzyme required for sulfatase activity
MPKRVQRGGSFLCSDQYCSRYMPGGRGKGAPDTGASHVGFRCVVSVKGRCWLMVDG